MSDEEDKTTTQTSTKTFKRVFRFKYADYAQLLGMTPDAVRKAVQRGKFDPSSLKSLINFYQTKQNHQNSITQLNSQLNHINKLTLNIQELTNNSILLLKDSNTNGSA